MTEKPDIRSDSLSQRAKNQPRENNKFVRVRPSELILMEMTLRYTLRHTMRVVTDEIESLGSWIMVLAIVQILTMAAIAIFMVTR